MIEQPTQPLSTLERVSEAYRIIENAEQRLRLGNDSSSGYRLLARASLVSAAAVGGAEAAAKLAEDLAGELRNHASTMRAA